VDEDQTVVFPRPFARGDSQDRSWAERLGDPEEESTPAAESAAGLASLSFFTSALRRRWRVWCATALIGFLVAVGIDLTHPPPYQASTSVIITLAPGEDSSTAILTEATLAHSRIVAGQVISALGLHESVSDLLGDYTTDTPTNRVLQITVSAKSQDTALRVASSLANQFLIFRAHQLKVNERLTIKSLNGTIANAQAKADNLDQQILKVSVEPTSPDQQTRLHLLQGERTQAGTALQILQQTVQDNEAGTRVEMASALTGSQVLDSASPVHRSPKKKAATYGAAGLVGGLFLGLAFVVIQALLTDRLRRRDDIAHALGAPVRLSVGKIRLWRARRGRQNRKLQLIVAHLRRAVPRRPPDADTAAALAIVSVDSDEVAALALVRLAEACAREGQQVVVADLTRQGQAARLLDRRNRRKPGVRTVVVDGKDIVLAVPDQRELALVGPWVDSSADLPAEPDEALRSACAEADLVLTLACVDPALGAEHLPTWAEEAVVVVTAGKTSSTRIHAVGELIRVAGVSVVSAILVGTDKTDESVGTSGELTAVAGPAHVRPAGRPGEAEQPAARPDGTAPAPASQAGPAQPSQAAPPVAQAASPVAPAGPPVAPPAPQGAPLPAPPSANGPYAAPSGNGPSGNEPAGGADPGYSQRHGRPVDQPVPGHGAGKPPLNGREGS